MWRLSEEVGVGDVVAEGNSMFSIAFWTNSNDSSNHILRFRSNLPSVLASNELLPTVNKNDNKYAPPKDCKVANCVLLVWH